MDAATRRPTTRDSAPYGPSSAEDPRSDVASAPPERRSWRRRGRRVNAILLVIAIVATIAGVAFLVFDGSDSATRPKVDAVEPVADGTGAAAGDTTAPAGDTSPTVPAAERPMLGIGSAGPDVTTLQEQLVAAGFDPGAVDGRFGPGTAAAVRAFQTSVGLTSDGVVGVETWTALAGAETSETS